MGMYIATQHNAMHSMYPAHSRVHAPVSAAQRKRQKFDPLKSINDNLNIAIPADGSIYGYVASGTLSSRCTFIVIIENLFFDISMIQICQLGIDIRPSISITIG
jgi:hypothetical protein